MWKDVPDAPGYRVSSDGMVQSCWVRDGRRGWKIGGEWNTLKLGRHPFGYPTCSLQINKKMVCWPVHRLVLEAFVGPRPPGMECLHEDGDPANNNLSNLSWRSHTENMRDKRRHGTAPLGERNCNAKLTISDVLEIRRAREAGSTLSSIAQRFGVHIATVQSVVKRKTWSHV